MRKFFDSIDTILTILEALEDLEEAHSVRKIEELTGVPKSTVHRILQELTAIGWAYQDEEDKNYYIGLKFLSLANEWRVNLDTVKRIDPVLRNVVKRCGQSAFINIIDHERVVCLHKIESNRVVRITSIIGEEQLFHATKPLKESSSVRTCSFLTNNLSIIKSPPALTAGLDFTGAESDFYFLRSIRRATCLCLSHSQTSCPRPSAP